MLSVYLCLGNEKFLTKPESDQFLSPSSNVYFVTEWICLFDQIIWVNDSVAIS